MRYKFFNTVIHRGWRDGGKRHEEREGLRAVSAPFWFILKDSVAISATVTQNKKCLKKKKRFFLHASSLQRWKQWLFFTLSHFPKIHPNQLLWLRWQLGKYQWCPIHMTCVKLGAPSHSRMRKAGWMQLSCSIIYSPQIQKKTEDWGTAYVKSFIDV